MNAKINFGASLDKNTRDFVTQAREKGLNTGEMEYLMKKVVPEEIIETSKSKDGFLSMGIGKYYGGEYCLQTLLNPVFVFSPKSGECKFFPHKLNQKTIDRITQNLKILQKNESMRVYPEAYIAEFHRRYGKTIDF